MEPTYILPTIIINDNINKNQLSPSPSERKNLQRIEDIDTLKSRLIVVLGEAGHGKSRFLKEIITQNTNRYEAIYLELKQIQENESIEERIKKYQTRPSHLKSTDFDIEIFRKRNIICLDALDEVATHQQPMIGEKIKDLYYDFPETNIIISCRDYIYVRHLKTYFAQENPQFLTIEPFDIRQAKSFLERNGFTETESLEFVESFTKGFRLLHIVSSPRVLNMILSIKKKEGIQNFIRMSRGELFEKFIRGQLDTEDEKSLEVHAPYIMRTLAKLALVMEITQRSQISHDELLTFFDEINSNLSNRLLSQITLKDLYLRTLLRENESNIQFENKEIQEYLAAKELTRLGRVEQVSFDLMINHEFHSIYPSWYNTLTYLVELNPQLSVLLIDYLYKRPTIISFAKKINLDVYPHILPTHHKSLAQLTKQDRSQIFNQVFIPCSHEERGIYLNTLSKLGLQVHEGIENRLKIHYEQSLSSSDPIVRFNIWAYIIYTSEDNYTFDKTYWKKALEKEMLKQYSDKVSDHILADVIEKWNLTDILENEAYDLLKPSNYYFIRVLSKLKPNETLTIDLIIESRREESRIFPKLNFNYVTSLEGIKYLLKKLIDNKKFYYEYGTWMFTDYEHNPLLTNIGKVYTQEIENLIIELVEKYIVREKTLLYKFLILVKEQDPDFLLRWMDRSDWKEIEWNISLKEDFINVNNISEYIRKLIDKGREPERIVSTFYSPEDNERSSKSKIYKVVKGLLPDETQKFEADIGQESEEEEDKRVDNPLYQLFKIIINETPIDYGILKYYVENYSTINQFITNSEKNSLEEVVQKIIQSNSLIKWPTANKQLVFVEYAIKCLSYLNVSIEPYRKQIIAFLPFAIETKFGRETEEIIIKLLPTLNPEESQILIDFYNKERTDNLYHFNFQKHLEIIKHYNLNELIPFLEERVYDSQMDIYDRKLSIETLMALGGDNQLSFMTDIVEKYKNHPLSTNGEANERNLSLKAIIFLAHNPTSQAMAIGWIFDYLKEEIKQALEEGLPSHHSGSANHYQDKQDIYDFCKQLNDNQYLDAFLGLLEYLLQNVNDTSINEFVKNGLDIIFSYLKNLDAPLNAIKKLQNLLKSSKNENVITRTVLYKYEELKHAYLKGIGNPNSFLSCVQEYNAQKAKRHANIANVDDLYNLVYEIVTKDIRKWIKQEGAYTLFKDYKFVSKNSQSNNPKNQGELLIQLTLKSQLEMGLLQRGLRANETDIRREEQLLDGKKPDFVISYGFIGKVVVELKVTSNPEVKQPQKRKEYKSKLERYIEGTRSNRGILLIFQIDDKNKWSDYKDAFEELYKDDTNIEVIGYNCMPST